MLFGTSSALHLSHLLVSVAEPARCVLWAAVLHLGYVSVRHLEHYPCGNLLLLLIARRVFLSTHNLQYG